MRNWTIIDNHISVVLQENFSTLYTEAIHSGSISMAYRVSNDYRQFFVKFNSLDKKDMFSAEYDGLKVLQTSDTVRVPEPIAYGVDESESYLVTEFLQLNHQALNFELLGSQLASLHESTSNFFGWQRNNTIGTTLQCNDQSADWLTFWKQHRLGYQLKLAETNGYAGQLQLLGSKLLERCDILFASYLPKPSLLHGDLWNGNVAANQDNNPVIYDPAVYYGDREADIAMTELFGGFSPNFYTAYNEAWQLDCGYRTRKYFYNLYHILNHLNLFGGSYLQQAIKTIEYILAEIG